MKHSDVALNKTLVRQVVDEVWNQGDLAIADTLCHAYYAHYDPNFTHADDLIGFKQHVADMRAMFGGLTLSIDDLLGEADKVGLRLTAQATHDGAFMGVPPTGRPVTLTGAAICRFAGHKIAQTWQVWNLAAVLPQVGAIPASGAELLDWGPPLGNIAGSVGTLEENKGVVQSAIFKFWNGFDWGRFGDIYHPDYRDHGPPNPLGDLAATRGFAEQTELGMPDLHTIIHDLVAEGDKVVKRWQTSFTHTGTYLGAPPTGNRGLIQGINVYRIADGRVAEIWWGQDMLNLLRTIGLLPS